MEKLFEACKIFEKEVPEAYNALFIFQDVGGLDTFSDL